MAAVGNGSATTTKTGEAPTGIEMRVHGIGDHDTYSALGAPTYSDSAKSRVRIGEPQALPKHLLLLVNWSRASRSINRNVGWYLAFPFTLMNVAGYMVPLRIRDAYFLRLGIVLSGMCVTVSMAIWGCVIVETILEAFTPGSYSCVSKLAIAALCPGILIGFIAVRLKWGEALSDRVSSKVSSIANILALIFVIIFVLWKPASRARLNGYNAETGKYLDSLFWLIAATMGVVGLVSLLLSVIAVLARCGIARTSKKGASYAGAAILALASLVLLHTCGSVLRLALSTVVHLYQVYRGTQTHASEQMLLPHTVGAAARAYWFDFLPVASIVLLLLFTGCLMVGYLISRVWADTRQKERSVAVYPEKNEAEIKYQPIGRLHDLISDISAFLPLVALVSTLLAVCLSGYGLRNVHMGKFEYRPGWLLWLQIGGLLLTLMLIFRWPARLGNELKKRFGALADVAGFWSPDLVPLAGESYRPALIKALRSAITEHLGEPIALVGHSQGSVVCAWFMAGRSWEATITELIKSWQKRSHRVKLALHRTGSLCTLAGHRWTRYMRPSFRTISMIGFSRESMTRRTAVVGTTFGV